MLREAQISREVQPTWKRILLLSVLAYEAAGALFGGSLLIAAPDGSLLQMPLEVLHGIFSDFLIPGIILFALGLLNAVAYIAVLRRIKNAWLLANLALGGFVIWFIVELIIVQGVHWLHAMWGLPVVAGVWAVFSLIPRHKLLD